MLETHEALETLERTHWRVNPWRHDLTDLADPTCHTSSHLLHLDFLVKCHSEAFNKPTNQSIIRSCFKQKELLAARPFQRQNDKQQNQFQN